MMSATTVVSPNTVRISPNLKDHPGLMHTIEQHLIDMMVPRIGRDVVRTAQRAGLTYEAWREQFGRDVASNRRVQDALRTLDALGFDVEAVLKRAYDAACK
jgi:hypothetical protein